MVSDDVLDKLNEDDDDSSTGSNNKRGRRSKQEQSREAENTVADTYSPDGDEYLEPDNVEINSRSEGLADMDKGEFASDGEGLSKYKKKQVQECREFFDDMEDTAKEYSESIPMFTMVFHSMTMNYSQLRAGIAETLIEEYNMEKKQAIKHTNQITRKAGEEESMKNIINILTKKIIDV